MNAISHSGCGPDRAAEIYGCLRVDHLRGFEPPAMYTEYVDETHWNSDLKLPFPAKRHGYPRRCDAYLLITRDGEYFVDVFRGDERCRGMGLQCNPPRLDEILLPTRCYSMIKFLALDFLESRIINGLAGLASVRYLYTFNS